MRLRTFVISATAFALIAGATPLLAHAAAAARVQDQGITVTGCIERDAAASSPIFKVIVKQADGSTVIYQLNAPGNSNIPAAAGKTAKVSGAVSTEKRAGRDIKVITVKTFEVVADGCANLG